MSEVIKGQNLVRGEKPKRSRKELREMLDFSPIRFVQSVIQNVTDMPFRKTVNLTEAYARIAIDLSRTNNPKPKSTPFTYDGASLRAMRARKWSRKEQAKVRGYQLSYHL